MTIFYLVSGLVMLLMAFLSLVLRNYWLLVFLLFVSTVLLTVYQFRREQQERKYDNL